MNIQAKKYVTLGAVLVAVALSGWFGIGYLQDVQKDVLYASQITTIKKASGIEEVPSFHAKADRLREFIHNNSQHKEDAEFFSLWRDRTKMAAAFIDYLEGRRKELPHMECSTRADLMAAILRSEGYRTRAVDAYRVDDPDKLEGHALLDVMNPDTNRWETQDPEYDAYWKHRKTGERASMIEASGNADIIPCNGSRCGWGIKTREGSPAERLRKHLAYTVSIDRAADERIAYHSPDIAPDATLVYNDKTGTFCNVVSKNCRDGFFVATADNLKKIAD
jgi:hypothetical protein